MTILLDKFAELVKDTELDFLDTEYASDCSNEDELRDWIQERISEQEIIYYHKAIEYIAERDPSLVNCVSMASDLGYELKDINSELLATILYQDNLNTELSELDLSECFEA